MTTEALKSTPITNLDKTPWTANTSAEGAPGILRTVSAFINPTSGVTVGSTYLMVRIPTTAKVKHVYVQGAAQTEGDYDIGLYYSDSTIDGTAVANQGTAIDTDFFAAAFSFDSLVATTDVALLNPTSGYLAADINLPIWNAANSGLTTDPGGFFDVVLTSTDTLTTGTTIFLEVQYSL